MINKQLQSYFATILRKSTTATMKGSGLYYVLDNVLMNANIEPMSEGEKKLTHMHIDALYRLRSFVSHIYL